MYVVGHNQPILYFGSMAKEYFPPYKIERLITDHEQYFSQFGWYEPFIHQLWQGFQKERGEKAKVPDMAWMLFQQIVIIIGKKFGTIPEEMYTKLMFEAYQEMWMFMNRSAPKRNMNHIKKLKHEYELKYWKLTQPTKDVKILGIGCCNFCDGLYELVMTLDEALLKQPLASEQCKCKWTCNCGYFLV